MEGNIYKPRYKISFLAKSKVGIYKESRLRRFFNIRGRKLVRRGLFKRYILVLNNMKWTVARRYIRPYMRRRKSVKRRYKTAFYNKQQLREFYGKFKEEAFRNLFRSHLVGVYSRNSSFYSSLERRIDMFLFRARHLPTLYAANQYVQHQGVEYSGILEKSPNALIGPGTSLLFDEYYWSLFSDLLYDRIDYRYYGQKLLKKRLHHRLKKKVRRLLRVRKSKRSNRKYVYYLQLVRKTKSMNQILIPIIRFFVENHLIGKVKTLTKRPGRLLWRLLYIYSKKSNLRTHIETLHKEVRQIMNVQKKVKQTSRRLIKKILGLMKFRRVKPFREKLRLKFKRKRSRRKFKRWKRRLKKRLTLTHTQRRRLLLKNQANTLKITSRLKLLVIKNSIWGKNRNKKRKKVGAKYKYKYKVKTKKRKQIKAHVFKLLKSLMYIYTRVVNLFILYKTYNLANKYERFQEMIWASREDLVRAEKSYLEALNLKKANKNASTEMLVEKRKEAYDETSDHLKSLLGLYKQLVLREKSLLNFVTNLKEKFSQISELYIDDFKNKRIYKRWKTWTRFKQKIEKEKTKMRRHGVYYFSISTKYKRKRRRTVPRLNMVHWYVPSYIHFDFVSMESLMLHDPLPHEIYHSFKCSLPKLHAFYRSRGL